MVKRPEKIKFLSAKIKAKESSICSGIPIEMIKKMNSTSSSSILERIVFQRLQDVENNENIPGRTREHLEKSISMIAPTVLPFISRLKHSVNFNGLAVIAEIKRASPSKGDIDINSHAPSQGLTYAMGGAAAISVLTEPKWFKGTMQDLADVRKVVDMLPNRPCILCKDFILTEYQILEARLAGADTILLIVATLSQALLRKLLLFSRSLGMEPLVEVATSEEMERALAAGSSVIGINNRDLNTFDVDMNRVSKLAVDIPKSIILLALSGIFGRCDVKPYLKSGVQGVLVGQVSSSLMHSH